jgi:hypothetical protein
MNIIIYCFIGIQFATWGSVKSIRSEWHKEDYWQTYVKPNYGRVTWVTGLVVGIFIGILEDISLIPISKTMLKYIIYGSAAALLAFCGAFFYGRFVYSAGERNR